MQKSVCARQRIVHMVLDHHPRSIFQERPAGQLCHTVGRELAAVRGIHECTVELGRLPRQRPQAALDRITDDRRARVEATVGDVLPQHPTGPGVLLDERYVLSSPAQGLDAEGAATREQVKERCAFEIEATAEHTEERLLHPICRRSDRLPLDAV